MSESLQMIKSITGKFKVIFTSSLSTSILNLMRLEVKYLGKPLFDLLMTVFCDVCREESPRMLWLEKKVYWFSRTTLVIKQTTIKVSNHSNKSVKSLESGVTITINPDIHVKLVGRLMKNLWIGKIISKRREISTYTPLNANAGDSNSSSKEQITKEYFPKTFYVMKWRRDRLDILRKILRKIMRIMLSKRK